MVQRDEVMHDHHDHEEKIFFPWMQTKIQLPPKMSADHKTLIANLEEVSCRAGPAVPRAPWPLCPHLLCPM